jgi:hypothetical protein
MQKANAPSNRALRDLPSLLIEFAANPVEVMRSQITLTWPSAIVLQIIASIISGAVVGMLNRNLGDVAVGIFIFPLTNLAIALLITYFLSYFFSVVRATFLEFRNLYSVVVLSTLPYFVLHTLSGFLPPVDLLGFALMGLLLIVGLVEQFSLDRKTVTQLIGGICILFSLLWMVVQVQTTSSARRINSTAPADLDRLEKEVKKD